MSPRPVEFEVVKLEKVVIVEKEKQLNISPWVEMCWVKAKAKKTQS